MKYDSFQDLFDDIIKIKQSITNFTIDKRVQFKHYFFSLNFDQWKLNLIWEFFWDDKTYQEIHTIFVNKKLIKKESDQLGKKRTKVSDK